MIIEIQQIDRQDDSYKCYRNGENICDVFCPRQLGKSEYLFDFFNSGRRLKLYFNVQDTSFGNSIKDRFTMRILEGDKCVGKIVGSDKPGEYGIYHVEYNGQRYISYMADITNDDDYLCIYTEEQVLVAEIRRTKYPFRDYDYYVAFAESDALEELLCLLAVHIDFLIFNNSGLRDDETYGSYGYSQGTAYHNADFVKNVAYQEGFDLEKKSLKHLLTDNVDVVKDEEAEKKQKRVKFYSWAIYFFGGIIIFYNIFRWMILFLTQ